MSAPMLIWDDRMLGYDLGGRHPMHPLRWELTWSLAGQLGVLDGLPLTAPEPAGDADLTTVHLPAYLDAVKEASVIGGPQRAVGHGLGSDDNPVFADMHASAALIAGGSITAARAIAAGEVRRAANIAGGLHHAMAGHAAGFCVYNDAALAIRALLDSGVQRVAYVDIDVHHGDGVQEVFYDDPRVLTVSLHESPLALWPGTGWPHETGHGGGVGSAVNIPLPPGTSDALWLRAFHAVVPSVLRAHRPDVLVTQHGADGHADDPLADLNLTVDGQRAAALALRDLAEELTGGRWLALGGGGYSLVKVVPRTWTHLLAIVGDRDLDPAMPIPPAWTEQARLARPDIAPPTSMSDRDGVGVRFERWSGIREVGIDRTIDDVRRAVFPLHGLDPFDPRD
ncbi:acetoin utilization protein AcuC [Nakamurella sp. A5-74]|uniref:Acetoin utilization protein AcuC n=1 Tax=Nakamurella sp. A5-74 TaxID=3158264 RepID=A0AAU8DKB1_9ACTN